jgi:hypothetical protein
MNPTPSGRSGKPLVERYFYFIATLLLLALTVTGFKLFYFHGMAYPGRPIAPPVKTLVYTHGVAMSLWMLLALLQPFLVASGNRRIHMKVGQVGALVAGCLFLLGIKLAIESCRVAPPELRYGPMTPKQFMSVPVFDISLFALLVAAGVMWRKRPDVHKPLMFLASLAAVGAAIARIDYFNRLYAGTILQHLFGVFSFTLVIGAVFLVAKWVAFRKFDRWFAIGLGTMVLWFLLATQLAMTPTWDSIASFLLR